jgi:hypothetical protein
MRPGSEVWVCVVPAFDSGKPVWAKAESCWIVHPDDETMIMGCLDRMKITIRQGTRREMKTLKKRFEDLTARMAKEVERLERRNALAKKAATPSLVMPGAPGFRMPGQL